MPNPSGTGLTQFGRALSWTSSWFARNRHQHKPGGTG